MHHILSRKDLNNNQVSNGQVPRREDFFSPIEQQFNKFFEDFFKPKNLDSVKASSAYPKLDVYEKDGELIMTAFVAGMTEDDLSVEVTPDGYLVLSGKVSEEYQVKEEVTWHIKEIRQSSFERRLKLPDNIEGEPAAELKNGMLTLRWKIKNYKKELPATKRITIKSIKQ